MLGMKVIYPLAPAISARMAWDTVLPSAEWQAELAGNISVVQNHPALLGYMVCDDCCSSREKGGEKKAGRAALRLFDVFGGEKFCSGEIFSAGRAASGEGGRMHRKFRVFDSTFLN